MQTTVRQQPQLSCNLSAAPPLPLPCAQRATLMAVLTVCTQPAGLFSQYACNTHGCSLSLHSVWMCLQKLEQFGCIL
eukprot:1159434-Pelagomonas_calceolata.AAC.2